MKLLLATLCLLIPAAHAQERTAAGPLESQMTWSTLKTLVDDANTKSTAAHTRIDQLEKCNKKGLLYAPGTADVDADGCKSMQDNSLRWSIGARHLASHPVNLQWSGQPSIPNCVNYVLNDSGSATATLRSYSLLTTGNPKTISGARCSTKGLKCFEDHHTTTWGSKSGSGGGSQAYYTIFTCD